IDFRLATQSADPNSVAGVERVVRRSFPAECLDVFKVFVEAAEPLATVTVDDINIAIRSNGDVSWVGPVEFLVCAVLGLDVPDRVKDLSFQIRLVDALADRLPVGRFAHILREVEEFPAGFLAPVNAMRGAGDFSGAQPDILREVVAPGFLQLSVGAVNGDTRIRRAGRHDYAVLAVHDDAAAKAKV